MTTLNAQIIEALKLGLIYAKREAKLFEDIPERALPMFYVTGRESDDRAEAVKMAERIAMMERVLEIVSQNIDVTSMTPTDHAVEASEWLRNRIYQLKGNVDIGATSERQRLEQVFELLATAHPIIISEDRKALLAQLETLAEQPNVFTPEAFMGLIKRLIRHLNGSPV